MNRAKLDQAVAEAERFIAKAKVLPKAEPYEHAGHTFYHNFFPREQGAIRRASLDLTRALAAFRRPGND